MMREKKQNVERNDDEIEEMDGEENMVKESEEERRIVMP